MTPASTVPTTRPARLRATVDSPGRRPPTVDLPGRGPTNSTLASERDARRALLDQVAALERELVEQRCSTWPRTIARGGPARLDGAPASGPRVLSLGALELLRDELVETLSAERKALAERTLAEEGRRRLREEVILDPSAHPGVRVTAAEVGEGGCGAVRSEPAGGLLALLMGWWRVVLSSGCP